MSFFKIPISKLLTKIVDEDNNPIDFNESQWAMVEGLEKYRFWVHIAARRTGKSYAAAVIALDKLLEPNQQVIVVAPNFTLSSIIWDYVTILIRRLGIECERFNQKDKIIKLINGSVFRLLSANNRDSLIGRAANLLIVDEAAVIDDQEYFTRDLRPALSTYSDSRCLFISTPRGKQNYLYEYFNRGIDEEYEEWGSALFTWKSNPRLNEKDINEAKKVLTKSLFKQEYECDWVTFEGVIYNIDIEKHLINNISEQVKNDRKKYDIIAGLDVGYRDATAFVIIAFDGEKYYIVDELVSTESTTSKLAEQIKEKEIEWDIETIYIDSAAAQAKADLAYDYDIYCENSIKSVNDGIEYISNIVERDLLIFDSEFAIQTFNSMNGYRWNTATEKEKPKHDWTSHCCDAIRYAIYTNAKRQVSISM